MKPHKCGWVSREWERGTWISITITLLKFLYHRIQNTQISDPKSPPNSAKLPKTSSGMPFPLI